jgi:pimeloyl-ACP methyl ester carboxylesterase
MAVSALLIPPTAGDASTWGDYAEQLRTACRVITYDRTPGRSLEEQAEEAAAVIATGSDSAVVVVGVSLGATVALRLAIDNPAHVAALHLHEPPFHAKKHPNFETIRAIIRMQRTAKRGQPAEAAEAFIRWAYTRTDGGCAFDEWPQQWRDVALADPTGVLCDIGNATGESIRKSDLTRLTQPVLCTAGMLSRPYTRSLSRRLAAVLPAGRYAEVQDAGHGAIYEQPDRMAEHTRTLTSDALRPTQGASARHHPAPASPASDSGPAEAITATRGGS